MEQGTVREGRCLKELEIKNRETKLDREVFNPFLDEEPTGQK